MAEFVMELFVIVKLRTFWQKEILLCQG